MAPNSGSKTKNHQNHRTYTMRNPPEKLASDDQKKNPY